VNEQDSHKHFKTPQGQIPEANCIFQQPWWLEAAAPGRWGEVTVNEGGKIVGRLPYVVKRKFGVKIISMPMLTQTLGPRVARFQ
jgi:hypothetical protein